MLKVKSKTEYKKAREETIRKICEHIDGQRTCKRIYGERNLKKILSLKENKEQ